MRLAEPREADVDADLLVGGRGEDEVARRLEALPRERGDRDRGGRHLALHVERAAAPDAARRGASPDHGIDRPLLRVGDDGVGVAEEQEARARRRDPGMRATRFARSGSRA